MILDQAIDGVHRLEANESVRRGRPEGRIENGGQPLVRRHGDEIPRLRRGIGLVPRAGRTAGRHLHRADECIEFAERAAREIVEVVPLARTRLVRIDVRVAAGVKEPARGVEHRERQVASEAVAIVEIEYRRPRLGTAVDAADVLQLLVVEGEAVPVDVGLRRDLAGHADRGAIRLQQIADILGLAEDVVGRARGFTRLAGQQRVKRQALDVDAGRREADVGIADGRARLFVPLLEPDAKFVGAARRSRGRCRTGLENRLVGGLRRRSRIRRLAADSDVVLRLRSRHAGQHHPHPRILGVDRVEVAAPPGILGEVEANAAGRAGKLEIGLAIGRTGEHGASGIEQFDHAVEGGARLVEIDPDFGSAVADETVDVDILRRVVGNPAMHLEPEPPVVVAALFLG